MFASLTASLRAGAWLPRSQEGTDKLSQEAGLRENNGMRVEVECYAGRKGDERPVRFRLDKQDYMVEEVLDSWYGPEHVFFKVRADDGNL